MTKNGWIREQRKDANGKLQLVDVLYVNGKMMNRHVVKIPKKEEVKSPEIKSEIKSNISSFEIIEEFGNISKNQAKKKGYGIYENKESLKQLGFTWNGNNWSKNDITQEDLNKLQEFGLSAKQPIMAKYILNDMIKEFNETGRLPLQMNKFYSGHIKEGLETIPYEEYSDKYNELKKISDDKAIKQIKEMKLIPSPQDFR